MPKVKAKFKELAAFNRKLQILASDAETIMRWSLYDGAAVAANAMRASIGGLRTVSDAESLQAYRRRQPAILSVRQKAGLLGGLGIAPMKGTTDGVNVRIGFDGYNDIRTERWPNGQPNIMIAASCEHGSSAMLEQPFIRPAFESARGTIVDAMEETAHKKIEEILG